MKTARVLAVVASAAAAVLLFGACGAESDSEVDEVDDDVFEDTPSAGEERYLGECTPWGAQWVDCNYGFPHWPYYGCAHFSNAYGATCYPPGCTNNSQCPSQMTCVSVNPPITSGQCQPKCGSAADCAPGQTCQIRGFTSWQTCGP